MNTKQILKILASHSNTGTTFQIHKFHFEVEGYSNWLKNKKGGEGDKIEKEEANARVIEASEGETGSEFRRFRFRQKKKGGPSEKPKPRFIRKWTLRQDFVRSVNNLIPLTKSDIEGICPRIIESGAKEVELDLIQDEHHKDIVRDYKRFLRTWGTS